MQQNNYMLKGEPHDWHPNPTGSKNSMIMITKTSNKCWPEGPSGLNKEQHIYLVHVQYKVEFLLTTASTSFF